MLKVMIAEDELLIAERIEDFLVDAGYEVCGIARTVVEGVKLGRRHRPDLAVLDWRLADGGIGTEIAAQLGRCGTLGVLYSTGDAHQVVLTPADGEACIAKPYRADEFVRALKIVEQVISTGVASPPYPRGFRLLGYGRIASVTADSRHS